MASIQSLPRADLPQRLVSFFRKFPPQLYSAKATGMTIPLTKKAAKLAAEARSAPGVSKAVQAQPISYSPPPTQSTDDAPDVETAEPQTISTPAALNPAKQHLNPFLPRKLFTTGKWRGPQYGLRVQADLVKLARQFGVEELLPMGPKATAFKQQRLIEHGLRIRGTGVGQQVKGHKWERTQGARLEKRRQAMENMPALISEWKSVSMLQIPSALRAMGANYQNRKVTVAVGRNFPRKTHNQIHWNSSLSKLWHWFHCMTSHQGCLVRLFRGVSVLLYRYSAIAAMYNHFIQLLRRRHGMYSVSVCPTTCTASTCSLFLRLLNDRVQ